MTFIDLLILLLQTTLKYWETFEESLQEETKTDIKSRINGVIQRASGEELRAAIDVGRKQYQPKQLKSCHSHCFL